MRRLAVFGFDDTCRFVLERNACPQGDVQTAAWLMWNPSNASHLIDDPTVLRVVTHSRNAGCDRSLIGNVWGYRTPYPAELDRALVRGDYTKAMHEANLDALAAISAVADIHIVAFGAAGRRYARNVDAALEAFVPTGTPLYCLGLTADNLPLHPLARGKHAVRNDTALRIWRT